MRLLLLLLLNEVFFVAGAKRLEKIGVEQRLPDVVELDLDLVNVVVQPGGKDLVDGAEL